MASKEYSHPMYLASFLKTHRDSKLRELKDMRAGVRVLTTVINKYKRGEITPGLFGSVDKSKLL